VKPAVSISQPADGGRVSRGSTVAIGATASDNRAVARVEFYVNNVLRCTDTQPPYSCSWAVPAQNSVTYTLRARAYDAANNTADATVRVTAR